MTAAPARPTGVLGAVRDQVLDAATVLTTPVVPDDYVDMLLPLHSRVRLRARIERLERETPRTVSLWLRPGSLWRDHVPGQYVRIGVDVDGVRHWRTYSLVSAPHDRELLQLTVTEVPGGVVSTHLVREARVGDMLMLDTADGDFVIGAQRPDKVLFLAAGSGVTPIMGLLRGHRWHGEGAPDVVVIQSARTPEETIFAAELPRLAERYGIRLVTRHTAEQGRLSLADLDDVVPDWRERETWACGPVGMLDQCEAHWEAAGLAERLHVERFRTSLIEAEELGDLEGGTVYFEPETPARGVGRHRGRRPARESAPVIADAEGTTPLLEVAEDAGLTVPSGCRMGICFSCATTLTEGAVRDLRTGEITTATPTSPVVVQTCVSAAAGPCHLTIPGGTR